MSYVFAVHNLHIADIVEAGNHSQPNEEWDAYTEEWDAYIEQLRAGPVRNGTLGWEGWGDDITLQAAANSYGVRIQVHGPSGHLIEPRTQNALNETRTLHVLCQGWHYTSLRDVNEQEEDVHTT